MKQPLTLKTKITIILIAIAPAIQTLLLLTFNTIDNIVHGDLYHYGLQFSQDWARPYWDNSALFRTSIALNLILIIPSIILVLRFLQNKKTFLTFPRYIAPSIIISLNLFATFIFTQLTQIIHTDLYNYGLTPNPEWSTPLLNYSALLYNLIAIATATALAVPVMFHFIIQEKTFIQKNGTTITKKPPNGIPSVKTAYFILFTTGSASLITSIFIESTIFAFIGIALVFFGFLFLYIITEDTKQNLKSTTTIPTAITTLNQIMQELKYKGTPIYLPPKYFTNPATTKVYIPKKPQEQLPNPLNTQQQESQIFTTNPPGMLINPPGLELTEHLEKTLDKVFTEVNLRYLQKNLPKLLIEELEITQNFELEIQDNKIIAKLENLTNNTTNPQNQQTNTTILGSPLASALACALTKSTGNPITIETEQYRQNGKNLTIEYREIHQPEQHQP